MGSTTPVSEAEGFVPQEEIDASCRVPVLLAFGSAAKWLVIGLLLGVVAAIKMHAPAFLAHCPWLTYGRVRPAYFDAIVYGFLSQAGIGAALWTLARCGRGRLALPGVASAGGVVWNLGVLVGVLQVLGGQTTGLPWMEFPRQGAAVMAGGYFLMAVSACYTLLHRRKHELYVSQWFILAALFLFPWILSAAYMLGVVDPVRGIMQAVVSAWYANGIQYLWLTPLGLALAYYLLPKLGGAPVYSNQGAAFGFWTLVVFGNWSGLSLLQGGPLPRWMIGVGVASKFVLLLSGVAFAVNWELTRRSAAKTAPRQPAGPFLSFGAWMFVVALFLDAITGVTSLGHKVNLTPYSTGVTHLLLFGFVGMVLLAAVYHIVPRLIPAGWSSPGLISAHFGLSLIGTLLLAGSGILGGLSYGGKLADPGVPFLTAVQGLTPFAGMTTLGLLLLLLGGGVFGLHLLLTVVRGTARERAAFCSWCCGCGTLPGGAEKKARAGA